MLFIKTIADSGSNIVFTFNGDGEANSFAVMICQCGASPGPRIIESTTPVLTTVEFSPLAMMCTLSPLLAILAFAPKLAICASHHYCDMTPFTQCTNAYSHSGVRNPTTISSAAYPRRITGYSNPCAFTGAANVTVKADTSNPHAITHTGNLRGIPAVAIRALSSQQPMRA